jgi:hypothetical protein
MTSSLSFIEIYFDHTVGCEQPQCRRACQVQKPFYRFDLNRDQFVDEQAETATCL